MSAAEKLFVHRDDIEVISCRFDTLRRLAQGLADGDVDDAAVIGQAIHDLAAHYGDEAGKLLFAPAVNGVADGG